MPVVTRLLLRVGENGEDDMSKYNRMRIIAFILVLIQSWWALSYVLTIGDGLSFMHGVGIGAVLHLFVLAFIFKWKPEEAH